MSDDLDPYPDGISWNSNSMPSFEAIAAQRLQPKTATNGFDPYKTMLNKKDMDDGKPIDTSNIQKWPEEDIKRLQDFCTKYGILGFKCGHMHPVAALSMLKTQMGIVEGPLEDRVPPGYEKMGTRPIYNSNNTYGSSMKKTLLNG